MGELAAQALERAPELPEWIEPGLLRARVARVARGACAIHVIPARKGAQAARL